MDIVAVTGGSGFLGQHIVQMLQKRADYVSEIKVLDIIKYRNLLEESGKKQVISYLGSITDRRTVKDVLRNTTSVIHVAGLISFGTFPDIQKMEEINVGGTKNIIEECLECNVERLVFCSTVDVVIGHDEIVNGDETTPIPKSFLFPGYPQSKYKAECLVVEASGRLCKNGRILKTAVLRANVMYGELDPYYITNGLKSAAQNNNVLYRVGAGTAKFQQTYVGNTAWAFICMDKALRENRVNSGEIFFIPDDTPLKNTFDFMEIFLQERNMRLSTFRLPYHFVYYPVLVLEYFLRLLSPFYKINLSMQSCSIKYINMNLYFSGKKARELIQYTPIFTPTESIRKCLPFYSKLKLK